MHIIGKTSEENLTFLNMRKNNVLLGKLRISYKHMQMDASMNTDAHTHTDGKNKNTTLKITKCMRVDYKTLAPNLIVPIITQIKIDVCL